MTALVVVAVASWVLALVATVVAVIQWRRARGLAAVLSHLAAETSGRSRIDELIDEAHRVTVVPNRQMADEKRGRHLEVVR